MNTVKIQLLRAEPALFGSDSENLLKSEMTRSVVLRTVVLTVLRVLNSERVDREEMIDLLYGRSEKDPKNPNNIDQSLTKVFKPLRDANPDLQRTVTENIIKGAEVDVSEFKTHTHNFINTPPQGVLVIEQNALQIISLYRSGLLPSWNDAWITGYRAALETQYCNFLKTLVHLLLEAKQTTILERIVYRAMEYHTDPNREEKRTLDKIIEQIKQQTPKQEEKPIPEPTQEANEKPKTGSTFIQNNIGTNSTGYMAENMTVNNHSKNEGA